MNIHNDSAHQSALACQHVLLCIEHVIICSAESGAGSGHYPHLCARNRDILSALILARPTRRDTESNTSALPARELRLCALSLRASASFRGTVFDEPQTRTLDFCFEKKFGSLANAHFKASVRAPTGAHIPAMPWYCLTYETGSQRLKTASNGLNQGARGPHREAEIDAKSLTPCVKISKGCMKIWRPRA